MIIPMKEATKKRRVLVSAFAFSPLKGSEFAIGWDHVRALAEFNDVCVITRTNERDELERYCAEHPNNIPTIRIEYVSWTNSSFEYPLREIPYYFLFRNWHWRVYQLACKLDQQQPFDAVHQLTPTGFREPGYLWKLDRPFVWGPAGGLQYFPVHLLNAVPFRNRLFFVVKNLTTFYAMHLSLRPRIAAKRAKLVIASTSSSAARMKSLWNITAPVSCEVNAPVRSGTEPQRRLPGEPLRIIWSGHGEPRKALNLVLLALQRLRQQSPDVDWELVCLGAGPLHEAWKALAESLGIQDRCRFLGRLPRAEAVKVMAEGHCFVQPSLYDATSSVMVEALSNGLPIACLDHCGFHDVVDERCGIRIIPGSSPQIVEDFAAALKQFALDEPARFAMAKAAQERSDTLTWRYKAGVLGKLYDAALGPARFTGEERKDD